VERIDKLLALFAGLPEPSGIRAPRDDERTISAGQRIGKKRSPPFIEITSPGAGDGKLHLLYHIIATAVLPARIFDIPTMGQESAIVVIDADNRFSVVRLVQIIRNMLQTRLSEARVQANPPSLIPSLDDIERAIEASLTHIHIFRPQSMASLLATISHLQTYLFRPDAHHSTHKCIHSIVLNSASAFYWPDRCDMDTTSALRAASSVPPIAGASNPRPQSGYVKLASSLRRASAELSCPVFFTTWSQAAVQPGSTVIRPSLPNPWPGLSTLRLVVQRRAIRKLPGAISAEEALRDRADRNAAVAEGWFDVSVNGFGAEEWSDAVRDGLRRMGGGGGFAMSIRAEGVVIEG